MLQQQNNIEFTYCDFNIHEHRKQVIHLLNHYISDPMGDYPTMSPVQEINLIKGLAEHPASFVLFISLNDIIAGLTTCFINFSTFKAKAYINIHDIIIYDLYRGQGLGRALLEEIIKIAHKRGYCKVTLEVRDDNIRAKKLYQDLGFKDTEPVMHFLTKHIL
jgi:ribosomal protein S18 acetylase RimI-like enzyme